MINLYRNQGLYMYAFWMVVLIAGIANVGGAGLGGLMGALFHRNSKKNSKFVIEFCGRCDDVCRLYRFTCRRNKSKRRLGTLSSESLAISLSLASGVMLCVVFGELLPESILM